MRILVCPHTCHYWTRISQVETGDDNGRTGFVLAKIARKCGHYFAMIRLSAKTALCEAFAVIPSQVAKRGGHLWRGNLQAVIKKSTRRRAFRKTFIGLHTLFFTILALIGSIQGFMSRFSRPTNETLVIRRSRLRAS